MARPYIPVDVQRRVRQAARNRCGYCLSPQHLVMARLEIEHFVPRSKGGANAEDNLWLMQQGVKVKPGAGVAAAEGVYAKSQRRFEEA